MNQDRVTKVVYGAGDGTVTGTYYPAVTAGATGVEAFNSAISSLDAAIAQLKDPDTGKAAQGIGTTDIDIVQLGEEHNFVSTYAGGSITELMAAHPDIPYEVQLPNAFGDILLSLLPILLIGIMLFFLFSQMQKANNSQMSFGKAKAKKSVEERPDVRLRRRGRRGRGRGGAAGDQGLSGQPREVPVPWARRSRAAVLLGGPLRAPARPFWPRPWPARRACPSSRISGSDFVEMFVGVGACARARPVLTRPRRAAPAIIFIDEIDAVGRQRGAGLGGGHDEREQTLNQLLVEMDGFDDNERRGAHRRHEPRRRSGPRASAPRPLRPAGHASDAPDMKGREAILKVHAKDKPLGDDVDLEQRGQATPGFTGADLANLMNEARSADGAPRQERSSPRERWSESMERVIAGPRSARGACSTSTTQAHHRLPRERAMPWWRHLLRPRRPGAPRSRSSPRGRALGYTPVHPRGGQGA